MRPSSVSTVMIWFGSTITLFLCGHTVAFSNALLSCGDLGVMYTYAIFEANSLCP